MLGSDPVEDNGGPDYGQQVYLVHPVNVAARHGAAARLRRSGQEIDLARDRDSRLFGVARQHDCSELETMDFFYYCEQPSGQIN